MPAIFHRALFVVVVGLFFATECFCHAVKIQIDSSWGGLGEPSSSHLLITGNSGKYKADGHAIDSNKIEALLRALDEPSVEQPSLAKCGIDQAWLESNYAMALESISHRKLSELSEKQIDLFKRRFTNSEAAQDAFAGLYKGWHTDAYPQMALKITRGETGLNISSDSQFPLMLPWVASDPAKGGFNCRISAAIADILQKNSQTGRVCSSASLSAGHSPKAPWIRFNLTGKTWMPSTLSAIKSPRF